MGQVHVNVLARVTFEHRRHEIFEKYTFQEHDHALSRPSSIQRRTRPCIHVHIYVYPRIKSMIVQRSTWAVTESHGSAKSRVEKQVIQRYTRPDEEIHSRVHYCVTPGLLFWGYPESYMGKVQAHVLVHLLTVVLGLWKGSWKRYWDIELCEKVLARLLGFVAEFKEEEWVWRSHYSDNT